jgi:hypothetical protein
MAVILNASTSSGFVQSADTSGVITLQNNGTNALSVTSGNLQFNSGYGSVATAYGCRAWVNFNGTGTVAIRASGNVTSITDNGTGDYTVNFTTAMPDVNYSWACSGSRTTLGFASEIATFLGAVPTTTSIRILNASPSSGGAIDGTYMAVALFR